MNVLEHIEDDAKALEAMASILTPGGVIVLIVPAFEALYGPIDRKLGALSPYTRASLAKVAEAAGLRVTKAHYMNVVGFFGWWTNAHVFHRQTHAERQIAVFDRYIVPTLSAIEVRVLPPFGQSLFAVLTLKK